MWPFRISKWNKRQKNHRRLCRQEEQELERLANTMWPPSKTTQEPLMTPKATNPLATPNQDTDAPFEGLGEPSYDDAKEFEQNSDPKGDACCIPMVQCDEPRCPCHE